MTGEGEARIKGANQDGIIAAGTRSDQMKGAKGADSFYWGFDFSMSFGKRPSVLEPI